MFNQHSALPAPKGSPISQALSLLGTAGGIGAAILLTPLLFGLAERALYSYLSDQWGDLASLLTVVMGGILCVTIFVITKLLITVAATSAIVALAARRVPFA